MSMNSKSSQRRILRDLAEWKQYCNEVSTIEAWPLETNIYEWHADLMAKDGPLKDIKFHLIFNFPLSYPYDPPSIELCNYLKHPNVFKSGIFGDTKSGNGYWICLDMIKQHTRSSKYHGWTSAYSIFSILLQLQSFLIGENIEQESGQSIKLVDYLDNGEISKIENESSKFKCNNKDCHKSRPCKNTNNKLELEDEKNDSNNNSMASNKNNNNNGNSKENFWLLLYDDIENEIINYLTMKDCIMFSNVCIQFSNAIEKSKILELHSFGCWYHRINLNNEKKKSLKTQNESESNDDDSKSESDLENEEMSSNMILGYGFTPQFHKPFYKNYYSKHYKNTNQSDYFIDSLTDIDGLSEYDDNKDDLKFVKLKSCEITSDLLSYNAFKYHNIRNTVWKETSFTHFLPIFINPKHGEKSMVLFEQICFDIFKNNAVKQRKYIPKKYHPMMGIHLILTIMSSLTVSVTKACDNNNKPNLFYSINIIETYMHLYHMLLAIYNKNEKYTQIISNIINQKCINFISNDKYRTKKYVPNFGTFKLYFTLYDASATNVNINKSIHGAMKQRLKWDDIKLPLIKEAFVRKVKWIGKEYPSLKTIHESENKDYRIDKTWNVSKKRGFLFQYFFLNYCCQINDINNTPLKQFKQFNDNFGCANKKLPILFQNFVKKIYSLDSIYQFFQIVKVNADKEFVYQLLKESCNLSLQYGYHKAY